MGYPCEVKETWYYSNDCCRLSSPQHLVIGRAAFSDSYVEKPFVYFDKLRTRFPDLVKSWFNACGQYHAPITIISNMINCKFLYTNMKYLTYCLALECLSKTVSGKKFSTEEMNRRICIVKSSIDDAEIRNWAVEQLKRSNNLSFRKKLEECLAPIEPFAEDIEIDLKAFLQDAVNARNAFIHARDNTDRYLVEKNPYILIHNIKLFTLALVLFHCGIPVDELRDVISWHWRF